MPQFKDVPDASQITMANVNHARHQVPETTAGTRNIYNENKSGKNKSVSRPAGADSILYSIEVSGEYTHVFGRMGWRG